MNPRIAFCGAGGTGKTTTANLLIEQGVDLPLLRSASRQVYEKEGLTEDIVAKMPLEEAWELQFRIFDRKIKEDDNHQTSGFIADRSILDHFAYCLLYCVKVIPNDEYPPLELSVISKMKNSYSHIFYFPYGLFEVDSDGVRSDKKSWQSAIDFLILGFLNKWDISYTLACAEDKITNPQQRVDKIREVVGI